MSIQQQVSRAIRILRGNRDVSARASHLVVQKDQLMTYESVLKGQAEMKKFFKSTFSERKIMSTKTSFKRIAAVAAVALTLGGFSAVSANATAPTADSISFGSAASAGVAGTAATNSITINGYASDTATALTATVVLVSAPTTSVSLTSNVDTTTAQVTANTPIATVTRSASTLVVTPKALGGFTASGTLSVTPDVAGTYVYRAILTGGYFSGTSAASAASPVYATWTLTVSAQAGPTAYGTTITAYAGGAGAGTAATAIVAPKTAATSYTSATAAETVTVALGNNASAAAASTLVAANAPAITATVSGPGVVSWNNTTLGKSLSSTAGSLSPTLYVYGDGTAGISTITFSDVDPVTAATVILGTATVSFYGAAAAITPTVVNSVIATGSTNAANVGAITAVVTDSNGNPVPGVTVYSVSSATTVVSNSYTPSGVSDATGKVSFTLTGVQAGNANITLTLNSSSAGTSTVTTAPIAVRVGSTSAASVKWSLDAASYVPGALVTASVTVLDAAGLPVVPGTYTVFTANPTFSLAPATTSPLTASVVVAAGSSTGTTTYTFNAPLVAGSLVINATTATLATAANSAVAVSLTANIAGGASVDAAQAAQDAANEATDAANAATDAANNAMDSADAAQQAAMDAGDKADAALAAVTDLATKVSEIATQISSLSAVVAKIAAAVAKISAKVKA